MKILSALIVALLCSGAAHAGCPSFPQIGDIAFAYANRTPVAHFPELSSMADAYCAQGMFAATIGRQKGVQAGYRASHTSAAERSAISIDTPLRGLLFTDMFLHDGARVPVDYAAGPRISADLIAVAADDDLQRARTPLEALRHIAYFVPVIDLSDALVEPGNGLAPLEIVASNLGTRLAVMGTPIPVEPSEEFLERLARIEVVMSDTDGRVVGRGRTADLLGHPMQALMWLARDLEFNAQRIQSGDRIALGGLFRAVLPHVGERLTARYVGPDIDAQVSVAFTRELERDQADVDVLDPPPLPAFVRALSDND